MNCPVCAAAAPRAGRKSDYTAYRCISCKHLFLWPPPSDALTLYTENYFKGGEDGFGYVDYDLDKQPMTDSLKHYLDLLQEQAGGTGHICDVGAATGFFLDLARQRGWTVSGYEPSDYAASMARAKGLNVTTGILPRGAGPFDAVTALDVIEHVPEPREFIRTVRSTLRNDGYFAINTPDSASTVARWMGMDWHAILPPEHLHLFNAKSLRLLLEQEGFKVVSTQWIGKRFTVQYIAQTLARWRRFAAFRSLADFLQNSRLGKIDLALNLKDNLFVIAKKRQRER